MALSLFVINRDIIDYMYRLIHQDNVLKLNKEYNDLKHVPLSYQEQAAYIMKCRRLSYGFLFNYRCELNGTNDDPIYSLNSHRCRSELSKNHHHAQLFP